MQNLKTVRSEAQNRRVATKRFVAAVIVRNPRKANESLHPCQTSICCPRSLLQLLIEIRFSAQLAGPCTLPLSLWEHCCTLVNCGFATAFIAPKHSGLQNLGL